LKRKTIEAATVLEVIADLDLDSLIEKPSAATKAREEASIQVTSTRERLTERKRKWLHYLAPKLVVGGALVLGVVTGANRREVGAVNAAGRIDSEMVQKVPAPSRIPTNLKVTETANQQEPGSIRIVQGQTLYHISVENLGRYDPKTLEQIRKLNPWLNDPGHIRAGQKILLPSGAFSAAWAQAPILQNNLSFPLEVGKE
jgi:LysM repeat protein